MRLTMAGKALLFVVGLAVLGYAAWTYRDRLPLPIGRSDQAATAPSDASTSASARPAASQLGVLARIKETGVLRVGMEPDAPPLHFLNDRKQEDGFDFRLAGVVAAGLGAKRVQVVE